jgi:hypothetical protein
VRQAQGGAQQLAVGLGLLGRDPDLGGELAVPAAHLAAGTPIRVDAHHVEDEGDEAPQRCPWFGALIHREPPCSAV